MERALANMREPAASLVYAMRQQRSRALYVGGGAITGGIGAFLAANRLLEVGNTKGNAALDGGKRKRSDVMSGEDVVVKEEVEQTPCAYHRVCVAEGSDTESDGERENADAEMRVEGQPTPLATEDLDVKAPAIKSEDINFTQDVLEGDPRVEARRGAPLKRKPSQSHYQAKVSSNVVDLTGYSNGESTGAVKVEAVYQRDQRVSWKRTKARHANGTPADHPQIESPGDEELMKAVLAHYDQQRTASSRRPLSWDSIQRQCGSRFQLAMEVESRVEWLLAVWKDPEHPVHAYMGEALKMFVEQYIHRLERGEPLTTATHMMSCDDLDDSGREEGYEQLPCAPQRCGDEGKIDCQLEEKVASIVIKHGHGFGTATSKEEVWKRIVKASRGRYLTTRRARTRTQWLCQVLNNPDHDRHGEISRSLRQQLIKMIGHLGWKYQGELPEAPVADATQHTSDNVERQREESAQDELLMKFVLKQRIFDQRKNGKPSLWSENLKKKVLKISFIYNAQDGMRRVRFLVRAFQNATKEQEAKLTPALRDLLAEYVTELAAFKNPHKQVELDEETKDDEGASQREDQCIANITAKIQPEQVLRRSSRARKADQSLITEAIEVKNAKEESKASCSTKVSKTISKVGIDHANDGFQLKTFVAPLLAEVNGLKRMQRNQRDEIKSLLKMLRDERVFHRQQTKEMIELIRTEREDRTKEFVAIMERFTCSH